MKKIWLAKDVVNLSSIIFGLFGLLLLTTLLIKLEPIYATLMINFGLFIIVFLSFFFYFRKKGITWLEFGFQSGSLKWIALSFLLMFFVIIVGGFLSEGLSAFIGIDSSDISFMENVVSDKLWLNILNFKIGVAILVPFAEEIFFRGLIFRYIRQERSFIFSAVLSSLLFSLMHFNLGLLPFTLLLGQIGRAHV